MDDDFNYHRTQLSKAEYEFRLKKLNQSLAEKGHNHNNNNNLCLMNDNSSFDYVVLDDRTYIFDLSQ